MNFLLWKREDWERYPEDLRPEAEDVIRDLCNWLICALYRPDAVSIFKVEESRLKQFPGLEDAAVNWGDLKCFDVEQRGSVYIAHVHEASPDGADALRAYLETWLQEWGWPVAVKTEW